ncbi:hypothetical protein P5673_010823, partial [Acropora cervicornis]
PEYASTLIPVSAVRENPDLPGSSTSGRKRHQSASSSDPEENSSPRHKTSNNEIDAFSVTALEEDVNELLSNNSQTDVNEEFLTELSVGLVHEEKKGPKVTTQLAGIQPENCSEVTVTRVNPEIWAPLNAAQRKTDLRMANLQQILQKQLLLRLWQQTNSTSIL